MLPRKLPHRSPPPGWLWLQVLGSGIDVLGIGRSTYIRTVPGEFNMDKNRVLELAQAQGCISAGEGEGKSPWRRDHDVMGLWLPPCACYDCHDCLQSRTVKDVPFDRGTSCCRSDQARLSLLHTLSSGLVEAADVSADAVPEQHSCVNLCG